MDPAEEIPLGKVIYYNRGGPRYLMLYGIVASYCTWLYTTVIAGGFQRRLGLKRLQP